ncbi:hypothetical protein NM208_g556 [Fusarium decemcellulare]|uniref:Uncharacterized protein n=2 Tax=Fusarium decemcellulare TaxID=57161 RepID=A0ACC1SCI9_9HYPO|nr:hypothetical protein NM208_g6621 [Fusarium decemcellulare]KAJ3549341.1 hypothetical protein NM208_g556 [Fusarium decemcellulare]
MARVWFVTGSSRGLGRDLVELVLGSGDVVVATARQPQKLNDLVAKYGPEKILTAALDVSDVTNINQVVKQAHDKFGRIDVVVNNAGYAEMASVEDVDMESFRAQFEANFFGVVNVTKAVLPIMRQQQSGRILQVSSVGGRVGSPGLAAYQSAKWAVGGFSTVLQHEVAPFGIRVTVLEPGGIKTDWADNAAEKSVVSEPYERSVGAMIKLRETMSGNWSEPADIASAILHISGVSDPPLRLLLGPSGIPHAKQAAQALAESDEKWIHVSNLEF